MTLSNIPPAIGSKLIGPKFCLLFLCTGTTLALFHISGNIPFFNDSSNIIFEGIVNNSLQIFDILIDTLSYPCGLLKCNVFILDNISPVAELVSYLGS